MAAILEVCLAVLSRVATLLSIGQALQSLLDGPNPNTQTDLVTREVDIVLSDLNDPTFGLSPLHVQLLNLSIDLASAKGAILAAIADLTNGATPVSLPVTPPSGYGYAGDSVIFNAVWNGLNSPDVVSPYGLLKPVGTEAFFRTGYAALYPFDDQFTWLFPQYDEFGNVSPSNPLFSSADILVGDDLLTFMTRENPTLVCTWQGGDGTRVLLRDATLPGNNKWVTVMDDRAFLDLKARLFPNSTIASAPVWPGAALVVMGTPVAIATGVTLTGPLHGIVVNITAITTNKPIINYDAEIAYKFIGAIAFVDDLGNVEPFQALGFQNAVYSCQSMAVAAQAVIRADAGVVGTVTPWVIDGLP